MKVQNKIGRFLEKHSDWRCKVEFNKEKKRVSCEECDKTLNYNEDQYKYWIGKMRI